MDLSDRSEAQATSSVCYSAVNSNCLPSLQPSSVLMGCQCVRPNTLEWREGPVRQININGPNWLVCLIKDTISKVCCNYPFFPDSEAWTIASMSFTHTHKHKLRKIGAHRKTHTSSSGCNWHTHQSKTINNHNHHYRKVISINVCVCVLMAISHIYCCVPSGQGRWTDLSWGK